jgi:putative ABC transport system permease protein
VPNQAFGVSYLAIRATTAPSALVRPLHETVATLSPTANLRDIRTMEDAIDDSLDQRRLVMILLGAFAALAIILAVLGIYGVISFAVTQRTRELGVRMALGATPSDVRKLVVLQGLRPSLLGLFIGIAAALAFTRLLSTQLFGVSALDPVTFAALPVLILLVSVLGSLGPAIRATRVDPMVSLRAD